jgi:hypothetical protein
MAINRLLHAYLQLSQQSASLVEIGESQSSPAVPTNAKSRENARLVRVNLSACEQRDQVERPSPKLTVARLASFQCPIWRSEY